jgi:hypothetical protein
MCEDSSNGGVAVNPPLGWVLSDRTRSRFADILKDCGNKDELAALEKALGVHGLGAVRHFLLNLAIYAPLTAAAVVILYPFLSKGLKEWWNDKFIRIWPNLIFRTHRG